MHLDDLAALDSIDLKFIRQGSSSPGCYAYKERTSLCTFVFFLHFMYENPNQHEFRGCQEPTIF